MLAQVTAFFADPPPDAVARHQTTDADHGRLEVRRHAVIHSVDWLFSDRRCAGEPAMPGLTTLAMVEATVERDGRTTRATRYSVCSAHLSPERFAEAVRAHWGIENILHWVLDTTFDEDRVRTRRIMAPPTSPSRASDIKASCIIAEPPYHRPSGRK